MTIPVQPPQISKKQSGSALLWVLVWLVGMAAIAFFCLVRHAPALETAAESRIEQALSQESATGIIASVDGYTATVTGIVENDTQKQRLLALAGDTPGVRAVIDEVSISSSAAVATANDDTPIVGKPIKSDTKNAESENASSDTSTAAAVDTITPDKDDSSSEEAVAKAEEEQLEADVTVMAEAEQLATETQDVVATAEAATPALIPKLIELVEKETDNTEQAVAASKDPSINLEVEDGTLMLDGTVATSDNLDLLIDQAKQSPEIDFISNAAQAQDDTKPATWLEPIVALLPTMLELEEPGISVDKNQITLKGLAPDQSSHDSVITRALQLLGDYALVERINIAEAKTGSIQKLDEVEAETEVDIETNVETVADTQTAASNTATNTATDQTPEPTPEQAPEPTPEPTPEPAPDTTTDPVESVRAAFEQLPSTRILFRSSSTILTEQSQRVLDSIAQLLRDHPDAKMDIEGHTDASGEAKINLELSQSRANVVRDYLINQGISIYRLTAYGFGEGVPIAKNDSPEGRALNRRIEFKF